MQTLSLTEQEVILIKAVRESGQGINSILNAIARFYSGLSEDNEPKVSGYGETNGNYELVDKFSKISSVFESTRQANIDWLFNKERMKDYPNEWDNDEQGMEDE